MASTVRPHRKPSVHIWRPVFVGGLLFPTAEAIQSRCMISPLIVLCVSLMQSCYHMVLSPVNHEFHISRWLWRKMLNHEMIARIRGICGMQMAKYCKRRRPCCRWNAIIPSLRVCVSAADIKWSALRRKEFYKFASPLVNIKPNKQFRSRLVCW
jgi:hypothetical protein